MTDSSNVEHREITEDGRTIAAATVSTSAGPDPTVRTSTSTRSQGTYRPALAAGFSTRSWTGPTSTTALISPPSWRRRIGDTPAGTDYRHDNPRCWLHHSCGSNRSVGASPVGGAGARGQTLDRLASSCACRGEYH